MAIGGYQQERPEALAADLSCRIEARIRDEAGRTLLAHDCATTRGSSGAPELRQFDGAWRVAGIQVAARPDGAGGVAGVAERLIPKLAERDSSAVSEPWHARRTGRRRRAN